MYNSKVLHPEDDGEKVCLIQEGCRQIGCRHNVVKRDCFIDRSIRVIVKVAQLIPHVIRDRVVHWQLQTAVNQKCSVCTFKFSREASLSARSIGRMYVRHVRFFEKEAGWIFQVGKNKVSP